MRLIALALAATLALTDATMAQVRGEFDYFDDNIDDFQPCWTESRVRRYVADQGYTNVKLNVPMGSFYQVKATQDSRVYLLDVNTCAGRIVRKRPLGSL